jgi:WD40 repeat protein
VLATLEGHGGEVTAVAVTPDGRRAVSGSDDNTLKVWELERGAGLVTLKGHDNWVNSVAVTSDGRLAVSGSRDKTLKVWQIEEGAVLATFTADHAIFAVACVSDRLFVAGDAGGRVHLIELVLPDNRLS